MEPFYLVGPTGSGKSRIALRLAELIDGEIINADAFQLYSELAIVTARPDESEEKQVPHHLYGVLAPDELCHAGKYLKLAQPVIRSVQNRGKIPILVGGSGLYIKALTHGLNDMPETDPEIRARLDHLSLEELRSELDKVDPESAKVIEPNNRRYLQRALEVSLASGTPASKLRKAWENDDPRLSGALLVRGREELYERINQRTIEMFRDGAVDEIAAIAGFSVTASKAIGVTQIQRLLQGELNETECVTEIQLASRRYAKRQMTWFRREKWLSEVTIEADDQPDAVALLIKKEFFSNP